MTIEHTSGTPAPAVTIEVAQLFGQPWDPYACVICNFPVFDDPADQLSHLAEHGAVPNQHGGREDR